MPSVIMYNNIILYIVIFRTGRAEHSCVHVYNVSVCRPSPSRKQTEIIFLCPIICSFSVIILMMILYTYPLQAKNYNTINQLKYIL